MFRQAFTHMNAFTYTEFCFPTLISICGSYARPFARAAAGVTALAFGVPTVVQAHKLDIKPPGMDPVVAELKKEGRVSKRADYISELFP